MGLHYPFRYTGHELDFLNTFIFLLDNLCNQCHTNDDVNGNCRKCPVGQLIFASKEYLLSSQGSMINEEARILRAIKSQLQIINPEPLFNVSFIFAKKRNKDILLPLRELQKDLDFFNCSFTRDFQLQENIRVAVRKRAEDDLAKLKKRFKVQ